MLNTAKNVMGAILGATLALLCLLAIASMVWWHFVRAMFRGTPAYTPPEPMVEPHCDVIDIRRVREQRQH